MSCALVIDRVLQSSPRAVFVGLPGKRADLKPEIYVKIQHEEAERVASDVGSGGLRAARMYCASNARKAVSTVEPMPTTPSSMLRPSNATHLPERIDNSGRRSAAGLCGCAAKYSSARSFAAIAWSMSLCFIIRSFYGKVRKRRAN